MDNLKQIRAKRLDTLVTDAKKQGVKIQDIADRCNMTVQNLHDIRKGKTNLYEDTARRLSEVLGVRFEYLMGYDACKTDKQKQFEHLLPTFKKLQSNMLQQKALSNYLKVFGVQIVDPVSYLMSTDKRYKDDLKMTGDEALDKLSDLLSEDEDIQKALSSSEDDYIVDKDFNILGRISKIEYQHLSDITSRFVSFNLQDNFIQ